MNSHQDELVDLVKEIWAEVSDQPMEEVVKLLQAMRRITGPARG